MLSVKPSGSTPALLILADHADTSNYITVNSLATLNFGAGFTVSSYQNDFFGTSFLSAFPGVSALSKCILKFQYNVSTLNLPYFNNVVFCPYDNPGYTDGAAG